MNLTLLSPWFRFPAACLGEPYEGLVQGLLDGGNETPEIYLVTTRDGTVLPARLHVVGPTAYEWRCLLACPLDVVAFMPLPDPLPDI